MLTIVHYATKPIVFIRNNKPIVFAPTKPIVF